MFIEFIEFIGFVGFVGLFVLFLIVYKDNHENNKHQIASTIQIPIMMADDPDMPP